jgi:hypothetical protein
MFKIMVACTVFRDILHEIKLLILTVKVLQLLALLSA